MSDLPAPLIPSDVDLSTLEYMPLKRNRLRRSKAWLICKRKPHLAFYMLNLWMAAYDEKPAGSLEDDDDTLADAAMCPPDRWEKLKPEVMRGFIKCADGRLYHETVCEIVMESYEKRVKWRDKKRGQRGTEPKTAPDVPQLSPRTETGKAEEIDVRVGEGRGSEGRVASDAQGDIRLLAKRSAEVSSALMEICETDQNRSPAWASLAPITGWLQAGADPDLDVYPTARTVMDRRNAAGKGPPGSPSYLTNAVMEAMRARLAGGASVPITPAVATDPAREAAAQRFNTAMDAWIAGGREGKKPELDDYLPKPEAVAA